MNAIAWYTNVLQVCALIGVLTISSCAHRCPEDLIERARKIQKTAHELSQSPISTKSETDAFIREVDQLIAICTKAADDYGQEDGCALDDTTWDVKKCRQLCSDLQERIDGIRTKTNKLP